MATLISSLIVAAISALTFVAYLHPKGFAKMYWPIVVTVWVGLALSMVFYTGYINGYSDAASEFFTAQNKGAPFTPEKHKIPVWVWAVPFLFMLYLQLLKVLPRILDLPVEDSKNDIPKDKVS